MKKYVAELIGTMVLVLLGCGSAVFAGGVADTVGAGVGTIGVAMAFGLSVIAMAYTIGNISGCHINPVAEEYHKVALLHHAAFLDASAFASPSTTDREHLDAAGHTTQANAIYEKVIDMQKELEKAV